MKYITTVNGVKFEIEIKNDGTLLLNGEQRAIDFQQFADSALYSIIMEGESHAALVEQPGRHQFEVLMQGRLFNAEVMDEREQLMAMRRSGSAVDTGEISIKSPMPGLVVAVPVAEGQEVKSGETVVILESMKMQNELKAPRDGVVQRINAEAGQSVEQNKLLVTIV